MLTLKISIELLMLHSCYVYICFNVILTFTFSDVKLKILSFAAI